MGTFETGTDHELLAAYSGAGPQSAAAFEALMARYGGMVHRTCMRVLGEESAAEDAAQAAFLVLARRAGEVRGSLAGFLHGVAMKVAGCQRRSELARRLREREAAEMAAQGREAQGRRPEASWDEIRPLLDEAIEKLPRAQREAVVLRYLAAKNHREMSRELGISEGAAASHLDRALERMRRSLSRRGVSLGSGVLPELLALGAGGAGAAACPAYLLAASGKIAAAGLAGSVGAAAIGANVSALAKGALKMMFWAKVKMAAAVAVAAATVSTAVPVTVHVVKAGEEAKNPEATAQAPAAEPAKEEVLEFRRLSLAGLPLKSDASAQFVCRTADEMLALPKELELPAYAGAYEDWGKRAKAEIAKQVDFQKEMVLAAFKGQCTSGFKTYAIERVAVQERGEAVVRIDIRHVPVPTTVMTSPLDLVACPRRDLPVVFYENGKKLAEVLPYRSLGEDHHFELGRAGIRKGGGRVLLAARGRRELEEAVSPLSWELLSKINFIDPASRGRPAYDKWVQSLDVDFGREMVLVALSGEERQVGGVCLDYRVSSISVAGEQLRVEIASHKLERQRVGGDTAYDLVACPRRDLPAVFFENGKEVARVPFAPAERALAWRDLGLPQHHGLKDTDVVSHLGVRGAWWNQEDYRASWENPRRVKDPALPPIEGDVPAVDFGAKTAAVTYRVAGRSARLKVERVTETDSEIRIYATYRPPTPRDDIVYAQGSLVEFERRAKPVVFFENDREVARVPFKAAEDRELAEFLKHVRYAGLVGSATVSDSVYRPTSGIPPSETTTLDVGYSALYAPRKPEVHKLVSRHMGEMVGRDFRKGDRLLFAIREEALAERPAGGPADPGTFGASAVKWSPEREKAVRFALAPGWRWIEKEFLCPWCRQFRDRPGGARDALDEKKDLGPAVLRGECQACPRKVGPATRGVELGLAAAEDGDNQKTAGPLRLTTTRGQYPRFKLDVRSAGQPQAEPEVSRTAKGGEDDRDTVFFIIEGPGSGEQQTASYDANAKDGRSIRGYHFASGDGPKPTEIFRAGGTFAATVWLLARGDSLSPFKVPGTYTVRAAAGRLVSNPVTVVVEGPEKVAPQVRPDPEAQKRLEAEEAEKAKLRAGPVPRWQPGGESVEAVDAPSGKLLWKMTPGFAVGNVAVIGGQWTVTSQDGRRIVTVDAATGKMLRSEDLAPAGRPEAF